MRRSVGFVFIVVILVMAVWAAMASVTFTPPDKSKVMMSSVKMVAQKSAPKASGTVSLVASPDMSKFTLTVESRGLDPKKVYTVWLKKTAKVKGKVVTTVAGIGSAPFTLKVDSKGSASTMIDLNYDPRTKWDSVIIQEHPDKNPKNVKASVTDLSADITQLGK